jgi:hypothetical protein
MRLAPHASQMIQTGSDAITMPREEHQALSNDGKGHHRKKEKGPHERSPFAKEVDYIKGHRSKLAGIKIISEPHQTTAHVIRQDLCCN